MSSRSICTPLVSLAAFALSGSIAFAQPPSAPPAPPQPNTSAPAPIERQPPSGPNMGPGMGQGPMRPGMGPGTMRPGTMRSGPGNFRSRSMTANRGFHDSREEGMSGGFRIAPMGMWWKSPTIVQRLTLTPDQVKRMDGIFQQSRLQLIDLRANVQKQEVMLEPLLSANPLDTARAQAQIDKVAEARADLEKANAHMLLGIRAVLTPDQWTRLSARGQGRLSGTGAPDPQGAPATAPPAPPTGGTRARGRGPQPGNTDDLAQPMQQP